MLIPSPFHAFVARHDAKELAAYSAIPDWTPPAKRTRAEAEAEAV